MKLKLIYALLFTSAVNTLSFAQSAIDTTLYLQNINVQGRSVDKINAPEFKQLTIEDNPSIISGTISETLRQLPSLVTDIEGGITLRGSNKGYLLLNRVPYGFLEEYNGDVLIQLPSIFFDQVAFSSLPPINMVPDGDVGVLNLSSAEYKRRNSPLQLSLGAGLDDRYNIGAVTGFNVGKFNILGKYNYRKELRERSFERTVTNAAGSTETKNSASARPDIHLADLTVNYNLSANDLLTGYGMYYLMEYDRYGGINNIRKNPSGEILNKVLRHRYNTQKQDAYAAELRWLHRFNNPMEHIEVIANYNNFSYDEDNAFKNQNPDTEKILAEDKLFIDHQKKNYYLSATYQKLFDNLFLLKTGYIGRLRDENYTNIAFDKIKEEWTQNNQKSNLYNFEYNTHAVFASLEKKFGNLNAELGTQAEYRIKNIDSLKETGIHLYPRLEMRYDINSHQNIKFGYTTRTIRPLGLDLNPFVDKSDATHIRQGNSDLKEEFIHSLELSYLYSNATVQVSPSIYYRNKRNRIMEVAHMNNEETIWKKQNLGNSQAYGFELYTGWQPAKWVRTQVSGNIYHDEIDGRTIGYDEKKSLICWDTKGNVVFAITPTTELQIDGFYISDQLTPQGKIKNHYSVNSGISQYLLNRKLRTNLSINNLFNSLGETTLIETDKSQIKQIRNRDSRVTWLTLTYNL